MKKEKKPSPFTFLRGVLLGYTITLAVGSIIVDKYFISREVFKLKRIYINGKMIKFCEDK